MKRRRSSRSPTTAWSPISTRRCPSWRRSWRKSGNSRVGSCRGLSRGVGRWRRAPDRRRTAVLPGAARAGDRLDGLHEMSATRTAVIERAVIETGAMALNIKKVGVVGAGQMGNGIAHVCALAGFDVKLNDLAADRIKAGIATIHGNLARQVSRKRITDEERQAALARITPAETLEGLSDCDLVVEAALEKEEVKRAIFASLCPVLKPDAILGTNTSSISITRLASSTDRPERFIGIHFMNPVPLMELVELIRGIATGDATFEATKQFVTRLGKTIAVSEDFPAFIVNRILLPMINEAIYTLYEGVGNVEAIDNAMRLGAHHPMGPLELADFIGLDVCLSVMQVLHEGLADSKYRPCPLLVKYVEAGWLGRKTKRGFYDYRGDKPVPTR